MLNLALLTVLTLATPDEDLAEVYPGKLPWSQTGLSTRCTAQDVWRLAGFELSFGSGFAVECGEADVAFGVHQGNVLWAVVFPHAPATITSKDDPGDGERTDAIYLRFAPAEIGRIFPEKTVDGPGDAWLRSQAVRIARHKIGHKWYTPSGNPTVVSPGFVLVDMDTDEGLRRFYELDANRGKLTYVAEFEPKTLPPGEAIGLDDARSVLDAAWTAYDETYPNFGSLKGFDWGRSLEEAAGRLDRVTTTYELGAVIADMVCGLEDFHAWVRVGNDYLPGYWRDRPLNANWTGTQIRLGRDFTDTKKDLVWSRTGDGIGYVNVHNLSDPGLPDAFDATLEELADTWALVVDLRFNGGGDETLARSIAGRFASEPIVYSRNRYRAGPGHDELGPELERTLEPRGPWRYESPVAVLIGQRTMSSAESFAWMLACTPGAILVGDRTAGSSGNPQLIELDHGIAINVPRWQDLGPNGEPLEHVGIEPDLEVEAEPGAFTIESDPVVDAALKRLRKGSKSKRKPGKRE